MAPIRTDEAVGARHERQGTDGDETGSVRLGSELADFVDPSTLPTDRALAITHRSLEALLYGETSKPIALVPVSVALVPTQEPRAPNKQDGSRRQQLLRKVAGEWLSMTMLVQMFANQASARNLVIRMWDDGQLKRRKRADGMYEYAAAVPS